MLVSEKKMFDMIDTNHVNFSNNVYIVCHSNKTISIFRDCFSIANDEMVLLNQQHDGHLYQYAEDAYKRQELKDFL